MLPDKRIITCNCQTEAALYKAYMPFLQDGGIFIRTYSLFKLGEEVQLELTLLTEIDPYKISAKVVWITPKNAQGNKPTGIGVQFIGEQARFMKNKIETILAGTLKSSQMTDTL